MLYLDDLKPMKLFKKKFYAPINKKDKRLGSAILLLTPNYESSKELMNNPFMVNMHKFLSYYIEKDIMYTINHESRLLEIDHFDEGIIPLNEQAIYTETTDVNMYSTDLESDEITEAYCKLGDKVIFFNELYDEEIMNEASDNTQRYRKILYYDRIRNDRTTLQLYKKVKADNPWITKTFVKYERYKKFNLFIDLYYYNQVYLRNNKYPILRSIDMYFEFISRFLLDKRIDKAGYTKKTVFIPVDGWPQKESTKLYDYKKNLNIISVFYKKIRFQKEDLMKFKDLTLVFFGKNGYFKLDPSNIKTDTYIKFAMFIDKLRNREVIDDDDDEPDNSADGLTTQIIDKLEANQGIKIHNLTGENTSNDEKEKLKAELVEKISKAAKNAVDEDSVYDQLEPDVKKIISDLSDTPDDGPKLSASRLNRIQKAQDAFMAKKIAGQSIKSMVNESNKPKELPKTALPIKTINKEWKELKAVNFEKEYDLNADIMKILNSLSDTNKEYPVSILDVNVEDTSTSEDNIYTYTVKCEDYSGKRFTLKFDIPKFRDNRFMRLRGNEKIFSIEMPLIPISKTDADTVQIVSFYNKIFIERYNTSIGKSNPDAARFMKALDKYKGNDVKITTGDNSRICNKYELPIDYIDIASSYSKIEYIDKDKSKAFTIYFNQDEIRKLIGDKKFDGIPFAIKGNGDILCYNDKPSEVVNNGTITKAMIFCMPSKFIDLVFEQNAPSKCTYSRASILNTNIPVIVILAHDLGLTKAMDLAKIEYKISDKRNRDPLYENIRLADGYLSYMEDYTSIMLMDGLKECNMENVSIKDLNSKTTWLAMLDNFGGRIKSDGLTNFKDLMYDPITIEVSHDYKLPETYHEGLIYASNLLVDNKFSSHIDLSTNRYRTNEVVAAQFYRVLSDAYKEYAIQNKHGKKTTMSMKQSAVIDIILAQNTTSDLSVFQPLFEIEAKNTISTKGVTGMNSDRAYKIDKRGYDPSMVNVIAQATNFASNVGINRQTSINPNIVGGRGYFKQSGEENMNTTNTFCMTEALSPFVVSSDDPFRNDMTFVQTSKHATPIEYSSPMLVTTGADAAMPYLCSDMFATKAKANGKVKEITDEYMIVEYDNKEKDFIRLDEQTMKNSDGGFYIGLQLKTDLKPGSNVKTGDILAYDKKSFSKHVGDGQLSYNIGCLIKSAIMSTEDGYEDAGVCSEWLTDAMAADIVTMKDISLPPSTNVLFLVEKGKKIKEGEPVLIFQNAYDEEDANMLLKNLNNDDGDVTEIGRNVIKAKVTGVVSDIKVYRTCEIDELSDSLKKIVKSHESKINKLKKLSAGSKSMVQLDAEGKLSQTGKLKNLDGVLIEIYMKYHDNMSIGDKVVVMNANKNVLMDVYPDSEAPYTDFRPNEPIDQVTSASSMDGRIITSIMKTGALNKLMIELGRKVCDINHIKWKNLHEIREDEKK